MPKDLFTCASPRVSFNFPRSSVNTTFAFIKKINLNVVEETDKVVEGGNETIFLTNRNKKFKENVSSFQTPLPLLT